LVESPTKLAAGERFFIVTPTSVSLGVVPARGILPVRLDISATFTPDHSGGVDVGVLTDQPRVHRSGTPGLVLIGAEEQRVLGRSLSVGQKLQLDLLDTFGLFVTITNRYKLLKAAP
jgi:hypothetical protein